MKHRSSLKRVDDEFSPNSRTGHTTPCSHDQEHWRLLAGLDTVWYHKLYDFQDALYLEELNSLGHRGVLQVSSRPSGWSAGEAVCKTEQNPVAVMQQTPQEPDTLLVASAG